MLSVLAIIEFNRYSIGAKDGEQWLADQRYSRISLVPICSREVIVGDLKNKSPTRLLADCRTVSIGHM